MITNPARIKRLISPINFFSGYVLLLKYNFIKYYNGAIQEKLLQRCNKNFLPIKKAFVFQ